MANRKLNWVGAAAVAVAFGMAGTAQAVPLWIASQTQSPPGAFTIDITQGTSPNITRPVGGPFSGGAFNMTGNWGTQSDNQGNVSFLAWCVDIFRNLSLGKQYDATGFTFPNVNNAATPPVALSQAVVDQVVGLALAGTTELGNSANNNSGFFANNRTDQQVSAAVQGAIWKVINPIYTVTITGNTGANGLMTSILGALTPFQTLGANNRGAAAWLQASDGRGQGQIAILQPPGGGGFEVPVPAPAAAFIFALGLVGLAAVRRRA
jgi:hypothetical protein